MKLQIEESYYARENLILELTTLKEYASQSVHPNNNNFNMSKGNVSVLNCSKQ
jgi:hypothetical protein